MIRRGAVYGPPLPEGALEDDGAYRGLMFAFIRAHLGRQFEFVEYDALRPCRGSSAPTAASTASCRA
ncbi:hypothetical protein HEP84_57815 [Streptomyces sp. RLB1-33]|nr:hypothetical protein [Streptomyces sp. RLB1-33]